jgi:hypothetical protein
MRSSKIGRSFTGAAIIESDRSKLLQRIEDADITILERSRRLSNSPANKRKEEKAITRALYILSLLRAKPESDAGG